MIDNIITEVGILDTDGEQLELPYTANLKKDFQFRNEAIVRKQ